MLIYAHTTSRTLLTCDISLGSLTLQAPETGYFVESVLLYKNMKTAGSPQRRHRHHPLDFFLCLQFSITSKQIAPNIATEISLWDLLEGVSGAAVLNSFMAYRLRRVGITQSV